jgi:hypothetical protein
MKYAEELKNEFKDYPFTTDNARNLGYYTPYVTSRLLSELVKENYLTRIGRGIYIIDESHIMSRHEVSERDLPPTARRIVKLLSDGNVDFMLTGMPVLAPFMHLLPYRLMHSVYMTPGEGERASELLNREGIKSIVNPKNSDEVSKVLSLVDGDLVIIREMKGLEGRVGHIASVERALVDLYYESTRDKIPVSPTEVGRILRNALAHGGINITRMANLASRHFVDKEIRGILVEEGLMPPVWGHVINDNVRTVTMVSER